MALVAYLTAVAQDRLRRFATESDRGDSPVPTAIIIAGLAVIALAIVAAAQAAVNGWNALIPDAVMP